jgi:serine/threonine-protein kinase RsbW
MLKFLDHPPEQFDRVLYEVSVPSVVAEKNPVLDAILNTLKEKSWLAAAEEEMNVRLVLEEAIINGMRHGNKYDVNKKVKVIFGEIGNAWAVSFEDEGEGFSPDDLPDPDDPAAVFLEGGRGVFLMNVFMNRVEYYNGGRGVLLVKNIGEASGDASEGGK